MPGLSYSSLLVIIAACASLLVILYLMRNRFRSQPDGLQSLLEEECGEEGGQLRHRLVIPLLVYEDRFPSFGKILKLVLSRFPLESFLREQEFRQAMEFLSEGISKPKERDKVAASMCLVVRTFLSDPNVEYHCRPRFQELLDQFLEEIETGRPQAGESR